MRFISTSKKSSAGLMPDSEDPKPPAPKEADEPPAQATELSDEEYQRVSDEYMELVHEKAEQIQEKREDVEVEYSVSRKYWRTKTNSILTISSVGWRPLDHIPSHWHICHQQAATKQADLVVVPAIWPEALRLGP
jgi:frataxin